ncbi:MAG: hypothetical protein JRJ51_07455 [Deltaproteobacteria bacterium]|nr:hypothetical protein [Deltaproteobacteria bacterium]
MFSSVRQISFSGYSMYPTLRPGDTLVVREIPSKDIQVGDILCIPENGNYVSHRVVHLETKDNLRLISTKGDNLNRCAPPVEIREDALLKVVMVKRAGKGLVKPGFAKTLALLSRNNLTYGIIKGKAGRLFRNIYKSKNQPLGG